MCYGRREEQKRNTRLIIRVAKYMTKLGWAGDGEHVRPAEAVRCALLWWLDELQDEELRRLLEAGSIMQVMED